MFLYSYGQKIFSKLIGAIEPEFADEKSMNPFDFWEGAPFKLKVRNVEGYRNYDKCEFGESGPLFDNDEDLENIWKTEYSLQEFVQPNQFKSYDDIKTRFLGIIKGGGFTPPQNIRRDSDDSGFDNDIVDDQNITTSRLAQASSTKSTKSDKVDNDEDFELFQSLIDD